MLAWRIYYRGRYSFDNSQGTIYEAPGDGVLGIVFPNGKGNSSVLKKWDWYYYRTDLKQWWGSTESGMKYQLKSDRFGYVQAIKEGAMVSDEEYTVFSKAAAYDPDFPHPVRGQMDEPLVHKGTPNG